MSKDSNDSACRDISAMDDYRLKLTVRNNHILQRIEEMGYKSVGCFCREHGISPTAVGEYINMKKSPLTKKGKWREPVMKLAGILGCPPDILFSAEQMEGIAKNRMEVTMPEGRLKMLVHAQRKLPVFTIDQEDVEKCLAKILNTLTERQRDVLKYRFGVCGFDGPKSFGWIGRCFNMSAQRIKQIENDALRKLSHRSKTSSLDGLLDVYSEAAKGAQ